MIEYWDIYDENRNKTGRIHRRGAEMQSGDYHLVIHVCIFNSKNELLIQRRHPDKIGWPGIWDISAAGSALQDEDSRMAAIREVKEELGIEINLDGLRPHFTINFDQGFDDYWFIEQEIDLKDITLQPEEVVDAKWVQEDELIKLLEAGQFIPYWFGANIFKIRKLNGSF